MAIILLGFNSKSKASSIFLHTMSAFNNDFAEQPSIPMTIMNMLQASNICPSLNPFPIQMQCSAPSFSTISRLFSAALELSNIWISICRLTH